MKYTWVLTAIHASYVYAGFLTLSPFPDVYTQLNAKCTSFRHYSLKKTQAQDSTALEQHLSSP